MCVCVFVAMTTRQLAKLGASLRERDNFKKAYSLRSEEVTWFKDSKHTHTHTHTQGECAKCMYERKI